LGNYFFILQDDSAGAARPARSPTSPGSLRSKTQPASADPRRQPPRESPPLSLESFLVCLEVSSLLLEASSSAAKLRAVPAPQAPCLRALRPAPAVLLPWQGLVASHRRSACVSPGKAGSEARPRPAPHHHAEAETAPGNGSSKLASRKQTCRGATGPALPALHRITESQNSRGRQGPLWVI